MQKTFDNYVLIATVKDKCTLQLIGNMSILLQAFLEQDFDGRMTDDELDDCIRFFETLTKVLKMKRKRGKTMKKEKEMNDILKDTEHRFIITENGLYIKGSPVVIAKQTLIKMLQLKEFRNYMEMYLKECNQFIKDFQEYMEENDNE